MDHTRYDQGAVAYEKSGVGKKGALTHFLWSKKDVLLMSDLCMLEEVFQEDEEILVRQPSRALTTPNTTWWSITQEGHKGVVVTFLMICYNYPHQSSLWRFEIIMNAKHQIKIRKCLFRLCKSNYFIYNTINARQKVILIKKQFFGRKIHNVAHRDMPLLLWAQKGNGSVRYWWHHHISFLIGQTDTVENIQNKMLPQCNFC